LDNAKGDMTAGYKMTPNILFTAMHCNWELREPVMNTEPPKSTLQIFSTSTQAGIPVDSHNKASQDGITTGS
jgi:hypothetical protein